MTSFFSDDYIAHELLENGVALLRQNKFDEAINAFDENLNLTPNDAYAHWNKSIALLSIGDYEKGFVEHDWGWRLFDWTGSGPISTIEERDRLRQLPIWHGEDISRDRLLVYHELGFGDAIMALRYLQELKRRADYVTLVVPPSLMRLVKQFNVDVIDSLPIDISGYDYRLPFFGVLSALHQTLDNIPRQPYIDAKFLGNQNKIGIAWSGRTQTMFSLEYFLSMFDHNGYSLYSLQLASDTDDIEPLHSVDFVDTVELISNMDHVVTVDTAVAHLAGAMGHPSTHLLLPYMMDWRWWNAEVWYPTIKTYHQETADDWSIPFARVNAALKG